MDNRDTVRLKFLKKAKDQINQKLAGREIHIIKAVNLLSDLESVGNLLKENASEWKARKPSGKASEEFDALEKNAENIEAEKKSLAEFITNEMTLEFPNFSVLATPIIGAKLLASAGSKKRLAFMPASTIQVLGAEKALFAHMRQNAKSPKHGHLFNHPLMQKLPRYMRGKVARIISGKLAIALKQDYFEGENTSATVAKELEEQISKISAEPITPKQQEREKELKEQHEPVQREKNQAWEKQIPWQSKSHTKPKVESITWTPEERKAYFAKQNAEKENQKPINDNSKPTNEKQSETATQQNNTTYPPRERSFSGERREGFEERQGYEPRRKGFSERRNYAPRRESSFGSRRDNSFSEERSYAPRRESNYGGERSFGSRKENSFSGEKSYAPRRSFRPRSENNFGERREKSFGERSFGPRREGFGEKRSFGNERSYGNERSFGERKPFRKRRENPGEDKGGSFGARSFDGERKKFSSKKKFIKPTGNSFRGHDREGTSQGYERTKSASFGKGRFNKPKHTSKRY